MVRVVRSAYFEKEEVDRINGDMDRGSQKYGGTHRDRDIKHAAFSGAKDVGDLPVRLTHAVVDAGDEIDKQASRLVGKSRQEIFMRRR